MRYLSPLLLFGFLCGCASHFPQTHEERLNEALQEIAAASREPITTPRGQPSESEKQFDASWRETKRFYALDDAATESFEVGKIEDARKYAEELLTAAKKKRDDWNYGNAIQGCNLVLGRIALKEGRTEEARRRLLEAGKSPGSPQMDSFGPNMSLAKDLLEKGQRNVVLEYFDLCRRFWSMDNGKLDQWSQEVKKGNAGWPVQFRFAVHTGRSRAPELWTLGAAMARFRIRHPHLARRIGLEPNGETDMFSATTLGDAIIIAERMLDARIVPHDEGKWFRIYISDLPPDKYALSDIHIHRDGDWFCPQQDTSVALRSDDVVAFEPLIC